MLHTRYVKTLKKKILLENLQDEENKNADRQNCGRILLWQWERLKKIEEVKLDWFTKDMIDNFFKQTELSYAWV